MQGATTPSVDRLVLEYSREITLYRSRRLAMFLGQLLFIVHHVRLVGAVHDRVSERMLMGMSSKQHEM